MEDKIRSYASYTVGVICALPVEQAAMEAMLDSKHPQLRHIAGDNNTYVLGNIGVHDVAIACLPAGVYGTTSAAITATHMSRTFGIKVLLMVGICGGVWSKDPDVRLGDVIVSLPAGAHGGVVQFDHGKMEKGGVFHRTGSLQKPPPPVLSTLNKLRSSHELHGSNIQEYISEMLSRLSGDIYARFKRPEPDEDRLFIWSYEHGDGDTCAQCDPSYIVNRDTRPNERASLVWYGNIASGNEVMKHAATRDHIAKKEGIIAFEMEAAGLMDNFPCAVIRGVCDYADSHKNKQWQPFAAVAAAAYAKEFLLALDQQEMNEQQPIESENRHGAFRRQSLAEIGKGIRRLTKPDIDIDQTKFELTTKLKEHRDSLVITNPVDDRAKLGHPVKDTCEWITKNDLLRSWLHDGSPTLWISGGPGKGKTMISNFLIQHLRSVVAPNVQLLFYLCDDGDEKRNNAVSVIRGLLWQIADNATASEDLDRKKCVERHLDDQKKTTDHFTAEESLWRTFAAIISDAAVGPTYLLLDGLNECDNDSQQWLVNKFDELLPVNNDHSENSNVKLVVISQESVAPLRILTSHGRCAQIRLEDPENDIHIRGDIEKVISERLQGFHSIEGFEGEFEKDVKNTLLNNAEGSFVYVGCVIKEIEEEITCSGIKDRLEHMPKGMDGFYGRILRQIKERGKLPAVTQILRLVAIAIRPLTVDELSEAIKTLAAQAIGARPSKEQANALKRDQPIRDYITQCAPLLEVRGEHGQYVVFFHYSAKKFLLQDACNTPELEVFHIDPEESHLRVARFCVEYIKGSPLQNKVCSKEDFQRWPGLRYAVTHWCDHTRRAGSRSRELLQSAEFMFEEKSTLRENWWQTYINVQKQRKSAEKELSLHRDDDKQHTETWQEAKIQREMDQVPPQPLHMACRLGLVEFVRIRIEQLKKRKLLKKMLDSCDAYGVQPLTAAAMENHVEVAKVLLDEGADQNIMSTLRKQSSWSKRSFAKRFNSYVRELKDHDALWTGDHTALYRAAFRGHTEMVRTLLEYGANPDIKEWADFTSVHAAAMNGSEEIMLLILGRSSKSVNAALDVTLITPLHYAVEGSYLETVRLLIRYGADVRKKQRYTQCSSLHCAIKANASTEVVEVVLKDCIKTDIHDQVTGGDAAIHLAAEYARLSTVQLLLDSGAHVDARTFYNKNTALHVAASHGFQSKVKLLIKAGADVHAVNYYDETALHMAAGKGYDEIVQLLLDHGAKVNAKNLDSSTPLHVAVRNAGEPDAEVEDFNDTLHILLSSGAQVNAMNDKQQTPLDKAANRECEPVIELLRSHGAVLHRPNKSVRKQYPDLFNPVHTQARGSTNSLHTIKSVSPSLSTPGLSDNKVGQSPPVDTPMLDQLSLSEGDTLVNEEPAGIDDRSTIDQNRSTSLEDPPAGIKDHPTSIDDRSASTEQVDFANALKIDVSDTAALTTNKAQETPNL